MINDITFSIHRNDVSTLDIPMSKSLPLQIMRNFSYFAEKIFNPVYATDLFPYPLKISEQQRFSGAFRGYKKRLVA